MVELLHPVISLIGATSNTVCPEGSTSCQTGLPVVAARSANVQHLLQILFGILAVVAVIFVTLGGLRYITDAGNPQEMSKARNTIIYAVAGLVISISGELIVSFILGKI
jgi:hypothetical protein